MGGGEGGGEPSFSYSVHSSPEGLAAARARVCLRQRRAGPLAPSWLRGLLPWAYEGRRAEASRALGTGQSLRVVWGAGGSEVCFPTQTPFYRHRGNEYQRVCTLQTLNVPRKPMEHQCLSPLLSLQPQNTCSSPSLCPWGTWPDGDLMLHHCLFSSSPQGHLFPCLSCPRLPLMLLHHPHLF